MSYKLFNRYLLNFLHANCHSVYFKTPIIAISKQMAKHVTQSSSVNAAMSRQSRIKIKDKSKFAPGTVKFQVLGSGANGAPRCLYLFTDHSR